MLTGWHVYTIHPTGVTWEIDLAKRLPDYTVQMMFDVGANEGQSALKYAEHHAEATIYSFEPIAETYRSLKANTTGFSQVRCFRQAFGAEEGKAKMIKKEATDRSSMKEHRKEDWEETIEVERVPVRRVDQFCKESGTDHIDLLKVDTEGHDMKVLEGASEMLDRQQIDFIQVEAGMSSINTRHVPLEQVKSFLEQFGYFVFGIYDQCIEWPSQTMILRRVNVVFVLRRVANGT